MSLETKSKELKELMATYDTKWLLGDLSFMMHAGRERARDTLGKLSSPQRQLYYLAGLNVSSDPAKGGDFGHNEENWEEIIRLLNEIEQEYQSIFFPKEEEEITEEWKKARTVAMPSFLGYFNQGPMNYEEQVINWVNDLFTPLDKVIETALSVKTEDLIMFYDSLDNLIQRNFQGHSGRNELLRKDWEKYTTIKMGVADEAPDFIKEMMEEQRSVYSFMSDHGMKDRFLPDELVTEALPIEKVNIILGHLSCQRTETDFLYYTETKPGNPLVDHPIFNIGDGMYQVFEVKQVIHAIEALLENAFSSNKKAKDKYVELKGNLLEARVEALFDKLLGKDYKIYKGYYVDGNEQDILILWKDTAFIIEAKGYDIGEPFRNPEKAFIRIQRDFNKSVGYGYEQTHRVEQKFIDQVPLVITDAHGNVIEEIDTTKYENDFSIIVNLKTFGQVQCDLSALLNVSDDDNYPWAVKLDDLETFLLTLIAQKKKPEAFIDFLLMRENLHGHLISSDELEICGGFISGKVNQKVADSDKIIVTNPDLGNVFDEQYRKGMGFPNERLLAEKKSGKYLFW